MRMIAVAAALAVISATPLPAQTALDQTDLRQVRALCTATPQRCAQVILGPLEQLRLAVTAGAISPARAASQRATLAGLMVAIAQANPTTAPQMGAALQVIAAASSSLQQTQLAQLAARMRAGAVPAQAQIDQAFASAN